ncbi:hypothetical protein HID58_002636, partial [Brassica napus]
TYELHYIDRWLREVNNKTLDPLDSTELIPNKAVSRLILGWCKENNVILTRRLGRRLKNSIAKQDSSPFSASLWSLGGADIDHELQRELVKTVFHVSVQEENRVFIAENAHGSKETQEDAAATLSLLSSCDSNMQPIGRAGALKPLIDVLDDDDASAFNTVSNRKQNQGVVSILTRKAKAVAWVDRILPLLALLSAHQQAAKEMNDPDFQERSCGKGCVMSTIPVTRQGINNMLCIDLWDLQANDSSTGIRKSVVVHLSQPCDCTNLSFTEVVTGQVIFQFDQNLSVLFSNQVGIGLVFTFLVLKKATKKNNPCADNLSLHFTRSNYNHERNLSTSTLLHIHKDKAIAHYT